MPNTGRPSLDCHLCRRRRVKCDLGRPGCKRCEKYGVDCPGYRDQSELVFRHAFPSRPRQAQRARPDAATGSFGPFMTSITPGPAPNAGHLHSSSYSDDTVPVAWQEPSEGHMAMVAANNVHRPLTEHWTSHSVPILLNVYSTLEFLQNIYKIEQHDGPLMWAAHLFTRTYVVNLRYPTAVSRESNDETRKELAGYMSRTLQAVSHTLSTPRGALRDDVLATVWILASYEILVGSLSRDARSQDVSPWDLHTLGLYHILKARGTARLKTESDRSAFWPAFNMVQIQALVSQKECPPESDLWLDTVERYSDSSDGMPLQVARFVNKVAVVVSRTLTILRSGDFAAAASEYLGLWTRLTTAERCLNDWIDSQPALEHEFDPYMRNLQYSAIITGYHVMQLLVNLMTHSTACPVPIEDVFAHRRYCLQSIRVASCGVIDNVPYAMGPFAKGRDKPPRVLFDALKLVWPLSAIYIVPTTRPEHKEAARQVLQFIGKEVGVLQALNVKPTKVDLPQEMLVPRDVGEPLEVPWVSPPSNEFDLGLD